MDNPFKNLKSGTKDNSKKLLEKKITDKAWEISKKVMTRKLVSKDVDDLAKLYKEYFEKYPDTKKERDSTKRITQLKTICK